MTDQLLTRIEKLERQNKKMKVAISALCLFLGTLSTLALTFPQKTDNGIDRLEVREIVLSDGTMSATLTPYSLVFSGKSGSEAEKATITASGISLGGRYFTELKPTGLICSRDGVPRFDLNIGEIGAALAFQDESGGMRTMLDETTLVLKNNDGILSMRPEHLFLQKGEVDAFLTSSLLRIRGADKYKAILGLADQTASNTGDDPARSAASLTFLGKDDNVMWQAP